MSQTSHIKVGSIAYVTSRQAYDDAKQIHSDGVIVWRNSFGQSPTDERYEREYEEPDYDPEKGFEAADHPFWDVE